MNITELVRRVSALKIFLSALDDREKAFATLLPAANGRFESFFHHLDQSQFAGRPCGVEAQRLLQPVVRVAELVAQLGPLESRALRLEDPATRRWLLCIRARLLDERISHEQRSGATRRGKRR